jgi:hypothetical protein
MYGHGNWHHRHHSSGCCGHGFSSQHDMCFATKKQKISHLEEYLNHLKEKSKAVEEHIKKIKEEK